MKLIKYSKFFEEFTTSDVKVIKYYCYDIDDNLLKMPTVIHMEKNDGNNNWTPIDVSTLEFSVVRNDPNYRTADGAFSEFRDKGPRGEDAFLIDMKKAILEKSFAPSWSSFINCLVNGNIFCFITARGHGSNTFRKGVKWIIDNYLTKEQKETMLDNLHKYKILFGDESDIDLLEDYLDACDYYGVSSDEFLKIAPGGADNPEKGKEIAFQFFTDKVHNFSQKINIKASIGMSDDDIKNVEHIEKFMRNELSLKYPIRFVMYDTSKEGYKKTVVSESYDISRFENILVDEVGKFWVVTYPTINSLIQDICFESDVVYFANQMRGGLEMEEVYGFYKNEFDATKKAKELLNSKFELGKIIKK
jgi:hypothetical protein